MYETANLMNMVMFAARNYRPASQCLTPQELGIPTDAKGNILSMGPFNQYVPSSQLHYVGIFNKQLKVTKYLDPLLKDLAKMQAKEQENANVASTPTLKTPTVYSTPQNASTDYLRELKFGSLTAGAHDDYRSNFGLELCNTASNYLGYNEDDGSYKLFTDGREEAWCADFVTHVVNETCEKTGKAKPAGFGSSSVSDLRDWGILNNAYLQTEFSANKNDLIAQNVKPGDVVIFKNGKSHTGIVKDVAADGSFTTIEGNTSDKVGIKNYTANDPSVSGFVSLA